jgi:GDP-4-dehydro-6-deoxy-D-mannose reductase
LTEATVPAPRDPYAVSKWAAALLAPVYWQRYGLPVVEARPFNHIGPRQAPGFVVPDFASQVASVKLGQSAPEIKVGNLDVERDFTDVRDVARAYRKLADQGQPGEFYIVCSGKAVSIRHILDLLIELSGCQVTVTNDPERMSLQDTLDDWQKRRSS